MADTVPIHKAQWSAEGLPDGLTSDPSSGKLTGTPTAQGSYSPEVTVRTKWGTAKKNISVIVINDKLSIVQDGQEVTRMTASDFAVMVRDGTAQEQYNTVNTQVVIPFINPVSRVLYDCPMNFCSFRDVELADGTTKPGLILQCAYGLPAGADNLQFDATENDHPNGNRWNGSNRWKESNIRQWLNASGKGWYEKSQEYDEPPKAYVDWAGFLDCFQQDFIDILSPIKIQTQTEPKIDGGGVDITYDTFFLPSMEEVYAASSYEGGSTGAGIEGTVWEYWQSRIGGESPQPDGFEVRNLNRIQYAIENHSQAVPIWLRSACLYNVYDVWCATLNGFVYGCSAQLAYNNRVAPACVVC